MSLFTVYLVGPITGMSYNNSNDWRRYVASNLPGSMQVISPLRGKNYLVNKMKIASAYESTSLSSAKGITCRDKFDVKRSDILAVNFIGAKTISIGSILEIGWGDNGIRPIIVAMEKDSLYRHPMLLETAGFIVETLDEMIELIKKIACNGIE